MYILPSSGNWFLIFLGIREICNYLHLICEPSTFTEIIFYFFGDLASLKLVNNTKLDVKKRDGLPFLTSLDACE